MAKQIRFINEISLFLEKFPKILIPAIPGNSLSFPGMAGIGNESSHCCWINWPVFLGETLITSFYDNKHLVAPMGKTAILRSVTSRIQFSPVSNIFRNGILTISSLFVGIVDTSDRNDADFSAEIQRIFSLSIIILKLKKFG